MTDASFEKGGLSAALENDFAQAAQKAATEEKARLEGLAGQGKETRELFLNRKMLIFFSVTMGLIFLLVMMNAKPDISIQGLASGYALTGVLLGLTIFLLVSSKKPFMTLTSQGILMPKADRVIPWTDVVDYNVTSSGFVITTGVTLEVFLAEGAAAPSFFQHPWSRYNKKKRLLRVFVSAVAGMSPERYSELFASYWQGGVARAELANMQQPA